ncbi:MAG: PilC/PilY family type IV pilus protein [Ferrimonas sp.]
MNRDSSARWLKQCVMLGATFALSPMSWAASVSTMPLATGPLNVGQDVAPMVMLVMSRDHTLYFEAYNDASDLDGDGVVDYQYKPSIDYDGYFSSETCYEYSSANSYFQAVASTDDKTCSGSWSGDFLNYLTMARIDLLRKVLYGGYRATDTATSTVLERAFIPQDAHSWGKQYQSVAVNGYDISKYTPYSLPSSGNKHFFGTASFSNNGAPELRVIENQAANSGDCSIWDWASTERPVLDTQPDNNCSSSTQTSYVVRVAVCDTDFLESNCQQYPNGNYKPIGLLHEFGENDSMEFGLLTGSYTKNLSGGVLRHAVGKFSEEINAEDGTFDLTANGLVPTIDNFQIKGFTYNSKYYYTTPSGGVWIGSRPTQEGDFIDWGNPVGEMLYESMRYFHGEGKASTAYATDGDTSYGLQQATWDKPYDSRQYCARANNLVISDIYPSYDGDQLPGPLFDVSSTGVDLQVSSYSDTALTGFNAKTLLDKVSELEGINGQYFIGNASNDNSDTGAPTVKTVTSLADIYGLAPQEPTKYGTYSSAAVAYYGRETDLFPSESSHHAVATYVVALSSPLPDISIRVGSNTIRMVPFSKTVYGANYSIYNDKDSFQPTSTIVDFYITSLTETSGEFRINYEDVEQGGDFDMDYIVTYQYEVDTLCPYPDVACNAEEKKLGVKITLTSEEDTSGMEMHAGYVISGTTQDGIYLDIADSKAAPKTYYLDTVGSDDLPYPNNKRTLQNSTATLPKTSMTRHLFPDSSGNAAQFLESPLYYAAKYGTLSEEWDSDGDDVPDNYFPVTNASELGSSLRQAFESIAAEDSPSVSVFDSVFLTTDSLRYQSSYDPNDWTGDLNAYGVDASGDFSNIATWSAAALLESSYGRDGDYSRRLVYTQNDETGAVFRLQAEQDALSQLSDAQQEGLKQYATGKKKNQIDYALALVAYLLGERSNEDDSNYSFRSRDTLLGDIINSSPYVVSSVNNHNVAKSVVVVGANDGMVHLFDADTGQELFAYVPSGAYEKLGELALSTYSSNHQFIVDGDITGFTDSDGKTTVVGTLGHGIKGLYALDVSDLSQTQGADVVQWEIKAQGDFSELGYTHAKPTIAKLANGKTGVIFPNGYNAGGDGAIYIADLSDGSLIKKLSVGSQTAPEDMPYANALAEPAAIDLNSDGVVDRIYAGDLYGNLWVFDVTDEDANNWTLATADKQPLFTAQSPSLQSSSSGIATEFATQAITVRPSFAVHPYGLSEGVLVSFGTGLYVRNQDASSTDQATQSFYVVWDKLDNASLNDSRDNTTLQYNTLLAQSIIAQTSTTRTLTESVLDWENHRGLYIDLINTADNNTDNLGERQVTTSLSLTDSVAFTTMTPNEDICSSGGGGWYMSINLHTGLLQNSYQFDYIPPEPSVIVLPPTLTETTLVDEDGNEETVIVCEDDCDPSNLIFVGDEVFEDTATPVGLLNWRRLY